MAQSDGSIIIDTRIDESGFKRGLDTMQGAVTKGMAAITAAIGAASVAVIALGSDFEQANAKASTLFGDAQVDMSAYQGKMLELSNKTGLAASELGNTMYDALSAGIPASDDMSESLGFLEKNSKLAKAGFTDVNTATTATAKVLNAYKMDVSETDQVHKVLIQTQNKGITTVNELGSVLSQVTPTAAAMNVSFEQVGAALANMTAQGTPTAQATTQLNQLFAELGKKGTIGADAMAKAAEGTEYAGKSFSQLMDEGVPLNKILDLMGTYADKNNLSMIDMFSSIESGKAALSMSGKNSEQFTKNLEAMSTECDVVDDAYKKVTDTFQEKSKKAVNSLKNVGIAAYEKFQEPLKGAMDSAQESIDSLANEMDSGKLGDSVDTVAEGFVGLVEIGADLASEAIPLIVDGFAFLIDHGDMLVVTLGTLAGAMGAIKAVKLATSISDAASVVVKFKTALTTAETAGKSFSGTLTLGQSAVGLLTGKLKLAEVTQLAWNTATKAFGGPVGLATIAIGALAAGVVALCITMGNEKSELDKISESAMKATEEHLKLREEANKAAESAVTQIDYYSSLKNELDGIVDADGRVREGYEGRAAFITTTLADALGVEIELTDGIISNYQVMSDEIDKLVEKKRAKAIIDSHEEEYQNALEGQKKALGELTAAEKILNDEQAKKDVWIEGYQKRTGNSLDIATYEWGKHIKEVQGKVDNAAESYGEYSKTIRDYQQAYTDYLDENFDEVSKTIAGSNAAYASNAKEKQQILKSNAADEISILKSLNRDKESMSEDQYKKEKAAAEENFLNNKKQLYELSMATWTSADSYAEAMAYLSEQGMKAYDENGNMKPAARKKIDQLKIGTQGYSKEYTDALNSLANDGAAVFCDNGGLTSAAQNKMIDVIVKTKDLSTDYTDELKNMVDSGADVFNENGSLTQGAQEKMASAFNMVSEKSSEYSAKLSDMAKRGEEVFTSTGDLTPAAQQKLTELFLFISDVSPNYSQLLRDMANNGEAVFDINGNLTAPAQTKLIGVLSEVMNLAPKYSTELLGMVNNGQMVFDANGNLTAPAQKKLVEAYIAMGELSDNYSTVLRQMAEDGQNVFGSSGELTSGAQEKLIEVYTDLNNLAPEYSDILMNMAKNGEMVFDANGKLTDAAAQKLEDAKKGADDNAYKFTDSLKEMAERGKGAIQGVDTYSSGANFIIGAVRGAEDNRKRFYSVVDQMASTALNTLNSIWDEHSPSKATKKIAGFFVDGLTLGIEGNKDDFLDVVGDLGTDALDSVRNMSDSMDDAFDPARELLNKFTDSEISELLLPLQEAIQAEQLRMVASVEASYYKDVMLTQQPIVKVDGGSFDIDYKKMGRHMADAIHKSGISVKYNRREIGRIERGIKK